MKKKVFISYSRRDMDFVSRLAEDLENQDFDVWYDLTDIDAGDRWAKEIQTGINESEIFAIVVSPNSLKSEWVEKEFLFASKRGLKIVPLLYEMCELPLWLMNIQYVDIVGRNYKKNFNQIIEAFNGYGRRSDDGRESAKRDKRDKAFDKNRIVWILGALLAIAAIFWGISRFTPTDDVPVTPATEIPIVTSTETSTATAIPPTDAATLASATETQPAATEELSYKDMVLVPTGSFLMGSDDGEDDEGPVHKVNLNAFYIDKFEVSNEQYKACVDDDQGTSACELPTDRTDYLNSAYKDYPVVYVTWDMAKNYCEWRGTRLPTEAEWEKAARDGNYADYPWGDEKPDGKKVNFCDMNCNNSWKEKTINDKFTKISPVDNYEAGQTDSGIYNLAGNVWEWVADWHAKDYYDASSTLNPLGPENGIFRVLRGGSWYNPEDDIRVYNRYQLNPATNNGQIGFRCAADLITD